MKMKIFIQRFVLVVVFSLLFIISYTFAKDGFDVDGFNIIPELKEDEVVDLNEKVKEIGNTGGNVWDKYNEIASSGDFSAAKQINSGIMTWNTIMDYLVFVVKFLSQLGLLVGVVFIIYAGYQYMLSVFKNSGTPSKTVKNAIIGVLIVVFSYAIMKTLTSIIGIS